MQTELWYVHLYPNISGSDNEIWNNIDTTSPTMLPTWIDNGHPFLADQAINFSIWQVWKFHLQNQSLIMQHVDGHLSSGGQEGKTLSA